MPFGRSHARSKSRSPAPPSSAASHVSGPFTPQSSRPPAFLPPSHYAAAAGLPYPGQSHTPVDHTTILDNHASPISYPALEESESSLDSAEAPSHFGAVGRLIGRTPSKRSTFSLTRSNSKGDKEKDNREKRQSQLADIPLLEMNLLPSLRDTVDKMTHPPKFSGEHGENIEPGKPSSSRALLYRIPPTTPEPSIATNIPRFRTHASPAPKSALKSPARQSVLYNASTSVTSPHATTTSSSRTPRSTGVPYEAHSESDTAVRSARRPSAPRFSISSLLIVTEHQARRVSLRKHAISCTPIDVEGSLQLAKVQNERESEVQSEHPPERSSGLRLRYSTAPSTLYAFTRLQFAPATEGLTEESPPSQRQRIGTRATGRAGVLAWTAGCGERCDYLEFVRERSGSEESTSPLTVAEAGASTTSAGRYPSCS
ncbi:hypothetical protein OH77DRAFT_1086540 [Trametes cingulata]|nr:hypothetical protein OH77DRAFT_1086540 [Trametes cingulata]